MIFNVSSGFEFEKCFEASKVLGLGRSFESLGFPGGKRHFKAASMLGVRMSNSWYCAKATLYRKLKETGDEAIVPQLQ